MQKTNYQHIKLPLALRIAAPLVMAGAVAYGSVEGTVIGWNYKSMKKQAALTAKFQAKYDSIQAKEGLEYSVNEERIEDVVENQGGGD